ncbi:MAG TPA: LysR family transcriptional regulator [Polyangiaceae bacterium]|nr:LysR family transcriptional regulator [Polyangiaceae bacterium]
MNYERLFAFTAFADPMNFTRAARQLHISQPALHVQVRKLAEEVGRPLYRRSGKSLVLTAEGKALAAFGREVQDRGRSVLEEVRGQSSTGPVTVASGEGAFLYLLGPAIRRFPKERWPLRLLTASGPETVEAIRESRAHLGVVGAAGAPQDLAATPLRTIGQKVLLPPGHRLARRRKLRPADLSADRLVVAPAGRPHRAMLDQLFRSAGCALQVAVEASGWELMIHFARLGVGIAVVNDFCPVPRGMVGVRLMGAPDVTYYLVERDGIAGPGVKAMRQLIVDTVRAG